MVSRRISLFPATLLLVLYLLFSSRYSVAQQRVVDVGKEETSPLSGLFFVLGGEPYSMARYVRVVEGSPFFNENWDLGSMLLPAGKKYDSIELKIDLLADEIHYKDRSGNPLIATTAIREIWLWDDRSNKRFHFVHSSFIGSGTAAAAGWHQLLTEGRALLFKKHVKEILEVKPYGSATNEQQIHTTYRYFVLYNNVFSPVKSLSALPEILGDKKEELLQYISGNKLRGKSDGDFISLVSYYNSLTFQ